MMSNEDRIEYNKKEFIRILRRDVARDGIDDLIKWLENSDFFIAPASTQYHLACPGGLCEHSLNVYYRLSNLCMHEAKGEFVPSDDSIAIVSLLHDVCKTGLYKKVRKSRKTGDFYSNGKPVWEDYDGYEYEDLLPYGHGEKSVYMISGFIRLTREEAMAIRWHMGPWMSEDNRSVGKAFEMCKLAVLNHIADMEASYLDEER